jgi:vancomycin permeability regulator SanA
VDCFLFLYSFLLKMSKFYHVERALLTAKLHAVQAVFPFVLDGKDRSDSWSSSSTPGGISERL